MRPYVGTKVPEEIAAVCEASVDTALVGLPKFDAQAAVGDQAANGRRVGTTLVDRVLAGEFKTGARKRFKQEWSARSTDRQAEAPTQLPLIRFSSRFVR
jgi:hypothetical protein